MKKIFALMLCLTLILVPLTVSAEETIEVESGVIDEPSAEENNGDVVTEGNEEDNSADVEKTPPEEEILPPEEIPEEVPEEPVDEPSEEIPEAPTDVSEGTSWGDVKDTLSGALKEWIEPNIEEIGVIVTLFGYGVVLFKKLKSVLNSMGVLNNNAITIAKDSKSGMDNAASVINNVSNVLSVWTEKITALLEAFGNKAEKEAALEKELVEIKNFLKIVTDANVELANEVANLIALANIPNYKKEELGATHLAAVNAIIAAEERAEVEAAAAAALLLPASTEEVKENVGEEENN